MSNKGRELYVQGNEERIKGNYPKCISLWKNAVTWFTNHGHQKYASTVYSDLGFLHYQLGDFDKAESHFRKSLAITKVIGYKEHEGWNINYLGLIFQCRGELEKALRNFKQALEIAKELEDRRGMNQSLSNIGSVHYRQGDLNEALKFFNISLDITRQTNDKIGKERCFNNIGSVYFSWKNFERALEYYTKSLEILKKNKQENIVKIGRRLHNIGQTFRSLGLQNKALNSFDQAMKIAQATSDQHCIGLIAHSQGEVYLDLGNPDTALSYLEISRQVSNAENDMRGLVRILIDQGLGYKYKNQHQKALKHFKEALDLAKSFSDQDSIAICYNNMGRIYQLQKNFPKAVQNYEKAYEVFDKLYSLIPNEEIRIKARTQFYAVLNNLVQVFIDIHDCEKALSYIDYNKGREMLLTRIEVPSTVNENSVQRTSPPELLERMHLQKEIHLLKQQLSMLKIKLKWFYDQSQLGNGDRTQDIEEIRLMKQFEKTLTELRTKEEELYLHFPTQGLALPIDPGHIIQEINTKLIKGWLIIEFYYDQERELLLIFCLEKDKKTEMYGKTLTMKEIAGLEYSAEKVIKLRSKSDSDSKDEVEDCLISLSDSLYKLLLPKKLRRYIKTNKFEFITIIPFGILHSLPLELIYDGDNFWSLKYNFSRAFNLQTLLAAINASQIKQKNSGLFIISPLADLDIMIEDIIPYPEPGLLDKLIDTANSSDEIIGLLENHGFTNKKLTENANRTTIIDHCNNFNYQIIHFGCHAFFNADYPDTSFLLIREGLKPYKFTANDISIHIKFIGNPLLFLFACETGGIETGLGDEIYGLSRGFITAGASGLFISGWKIFERSAKDFAEIFYHYWIEGDPIAKAIQKARNDIRKKANKEEYIAEPYNLLHWGVFRFYGHPYVQLDL